MEKALAEAVLGTFDFPLIFDDVVYTLHQKNGLRRA